MYTDYDYCSSSLTRICDADLFSRTSYCCNSSFYLTNSVILLPCFTSPGVPFKVKSLLIFTHLFSLAQSNSVASLLTCHSALPLLTSFRALQISPAFPSLHAAVNTCCCAYIWCPSLYVADSPHPSIHGRTVPCGGSLEVFSEEELIRSCFAS